MKFKGRIANLAIPAVLLVFVSTFLILGKYHWDYPVSVILFPLVVGTLVILCAVWLMIRSAVTPLETLSAEGESIGESHDPRTSLLKRILWVGSVYPLSYVLGLIAGLMLFTIVYTSYHRLPWSQRLMATSIVFALIYIGFYKLLGVSGLPIAPLWMRN